MSPQKQNNYALQSFIVTVFKLFQICSQEYDGNRHSIALGTGVGVNLEFYICV